MKRKFNAVFCPICRVKGNGAWAYHQTCRNKGLALEIPAALIQKIQYPKAEYPSESRYPKDSPDVTRVPRGTSSAVLSEDKRKDGMSLADVGIVVVKNDEDEVSDEMDLETAPEEEISDEEIQEEIERAKDEISEDEVDEEIEEPEEEMVEDKVSIEDVQAKFAELAAMMEQLSGMPMPQPEEEVSEDLGLEEEIEVEE